MTWVLSFPQDDTGASAVEYALLLVGFALTVAGTAAIFGTTIGALFESVAALLTS